MSHGEQMNREEKAVMAKKEAGELLTSSNEQFTWSQMLKRHDAVGSNARAIRDGR